MNTRYLLPLIGLLAVVAGVFILRPRATPPIDPSVPESVIGPPWFREMNVGIEFRYRNGEEADQYTILESLGGGVAMLDYDADGLLDVFVTGGGTFESSRIVGQGNRLFRNRGDWKFEDVTAQTHLNAPVFYSHGCAVTDFNRDGRPDLLVTGFGRLTLYRNDQGVFTDVTKDAKLSDFPWTTSAAFGDLDGDGWPDLYICQYVKWSFETNPKCPIAGKPGTQDVCPPQRFEPLPHVLYRNNRDGTFTDVTKQAGLRTDGKGLGVIMADFNDDGRTDIYVANDASDNFMYLNRGNWKFDEIGRNTGTALDEHGMYNGSMGVDMSDVDSSGRPSLLVTNFQDEYHALYLNLGKERFLHSTRSFGIGRIGQRYVGFGTGFADFDRDGWEDFVIANGHVLRHPINTESKQCPVLMRNEADGERRIFRAITEQGGDYFRESHLGRGLAVGDLDNDGWPDLVISHQNEPITFLRNVVADFEKDTHWLGVKLVGRDHRDVTGSRVELEIGGRKLVRFVKSGGSYLSSGDSRLLFGLGKESGPGKLTIVWSGGERQIVPVPEMDRYLSVQEIGK